MPESNSELNAVYDYIEARRDEFVRQLMDYVSMPSIRAHGIKTGAAILWELGAL